MVEILAALMIDEILLLIMLAKRGHLDDSSEMGLDLWLKSGSKQISTDILYID
jgi:hypothetical protein